MNRTVIILVAACVAAVSLCISLPISDCDYACFNATRSCNNSAVNPSKTVRAQPEILSALNQLWRNSTAEEGRNIMRYSTRGICLNATDKGIAYMIDSAVFPPSFNATCPSMDLTFNASDCKTNAMLITRPCSRCCTPSDDDRKLLKENNFTLVGIQCSKEEMRFIDRDDEFGGYNLTLDAPPKPPADYKGLIIYLAATFIIAAYFGKKLSG
ncbi:Uncharacterised protein [uncultured archaeon]|nr:Uncharacterised protein [uncultured archaeon]